MVELLHLDGIKFALVSHVLPPSWSGQAVVIYRLLQAFDPRCYCLISGQNYDPKIYKGEVDSRLSAHYYYLPPELRIPGPESILFMLRSWLKTLQRARQIASIVRHERSNAIVACTGDLYDLPAVFLASRWTGARYFLYMFDDYFCQWTMPVYRFFARRFEPGLPKGADGIVVPNEFLREEYRRRYGVEPVMIHNPCGMSMLGPGPKVPWPAEQGEIKIVYTGAVYHAHYDAFHNLLAAIQQIGRPEIKLHIYTAQSPNDLEQKGIRGPIAFHPHLSPSQVIEVQQKADILFLPLAFNSLIPEVIKTSAPGKMGEYMASGRPILVHAPGDSYVSWYFKEHECGVVVGRSEPPALAEAIQDILGNVGLRQGLRKNALTRARTDFNLAVARAEFLKLFQPKERG